VEQVHAFFH
jgi:hypothetical protein